MNKTINPDMIRLARESRGFTQSQIANILEISQGNLSKIENGTILDLPKDVLKNLSKVLDYPEDFFFLNESIYGPGLAFIYHRSRRSLSKKISERIEALINIHRIVISRLLKSVEVDTQFPHFDSESSSIEEIANAVRTAWFLPRGPIKNLIQAIEKAGGIVIKCDFGTPKIDALSLFIPNLPPLFFINKNIPCDRLRFSLAHELGHVIMHRIPQPDSDMEAEADKFAGAFLMPEKDIGSSLNNLKFYTLAQLKPYWKVSMSSMLVRAGHLGKITKSQSNYLWSQMGPYKQREPIELDIPAENPSALKKLIDIHLNELNYSLPELSKVTYLFPHEFRENYLDEEKHLKLVRLDSVK